MSAWGHLIRQPCIGVYLKEVALVVNDTGPLGGIAVVIHLHMPCPLRNVSSASPDQAQLRCQIEPMDGLKMKMQDTQD